VHFFRLFRFITALTQYRFGGNGDPSSRWVFFFLYLKGIIVRIYIAPSLNKDGYNLVWLVGSQLFIIYHSLDYENVLKVGEQLVHDMSSVEKIQLEHSGLYTYE